MRVLVLCGDRWHRPETARAGLAPLAAHGFAFDFIEDARDWSSERMAENAVTLLTKSNHISFTDWTPWITDGVEAVLADYVRRGHGLLVIHSGATEYQDRPALRALVGGVFVSHPAQCPVTVQPLAGHPLAARCAPFTVVDEHYNMAMDDPEVDLFLTTESEHGSQPAGWTRREGAGRVCAVTPGHNLEVWLHEHYQALIRNTLEWCGGSIQGHV